MKRSFIILSIFALFAVSAGEVWADELKDVAGVSSFQKVIEVPNVKVWVPTVVAVPIPSPVSSGERYYVLDTQTETYVGSYVDREAVVTKAPVSVETTPFVYNAAAMVDEDRDTYAEFALPETGEGMVEIIVKTVEPIITSQLRLRLSPHVALPRTIEIKAYDERTGQMQLVVATKSMTDTVINFPEVRSNNFKITFKYSQLLRIAEFELVQEGTLSGYQNAVRFLAQPNRAYNIYYEADQRVSVVATETGDLVSDREVMTLPSYPVVSNRYYVPADVDGDGVRDTFDNCVNTANADQVDIDRNGRGDVCDDFDRDGLRNDSDNCVNQPNRDQLDTDHDGIGDACDTEESRFTERNPWVPWIGMGAAALVLLVLFALVARKPEIEGGEKREE